MEELKIYLQKIWLPCIPSVGVCAIRNKTNFTQPPNGLVCYSWSETSHIGPRSSGGFAFSGAILHAFPYYYDTATQQIICKSINCIQFDLCLFHLLKSAADKVVMVRLILWICMQFLLNWYVSGRVVHIWCCSGREGVHTTGLAHLMKREPTRQTKTSALTTKSGQSQWISKLKIESVVVIGVHSAI